MKTEQLINYLLRLSDAKLLLMKDLLETTKKQGQILDLEEAEDLEDLIREKQKLIEKIDVLDKEFVEKYDDLKKKLGVDKLQDLEGKELSGFQDLKSRIGEIMDVIHEISPLDQNNNEKIKGNILKIKKNLKTIKTGQKALSEYNKPYKENPSIFLDKKK